jgi:hypothetical protein
VREIGRYLFDILFLLFFPLAIAFIRLDDWWHALGKQAARSIGGAGCVRTELGGRRRQGLARRGLVFKP